MFDEPRLMLEVRCLAGRVGLAGFWNSGDGRIHFIPEHLLLILSHCLTPLIVLLCCSWFSIVHLNIGLFLYHTASRQLQFLHTQLQVIFSPRFGSDSSNIHHLDHFDINTVIFGVFSDCCKVAGESALISGTNLASRSQPSHPPAQSHLLTLPPLAKTTAYERKRTRSP